MAKIDLTDKRVIEFLRKHPPKLTGDKLRAAILEFEDEPTN